MLIPLHRFIFEKLTSFSKKIHNTCLLFIFVSAIPTSAFNQTFSGAGGLLIPPGAPGATVGITTSDASVSGVGMITSCTEISVFLNITHTWVGDIGITLTSPTGLVLDLCTGNGLSGDDFTNTLFIDSAPNFITSGTPPFSGSFRPEGRATTATAPFSNANPLGTFTFSNTYTGTNADGNWTLTVDDFVGGDVGTLNFWDITFSGGGTSPNDDSMDECETTQGSGTAVFDLTTLDANVNNGTGLPVSYWLDQAATIPVSSPTAHTSGTTTIYATIPGGCGQPAEITLTVSPLPLVNPISFGQCDIGNGTAVFDLTQIESAVMGGSSNSISWFEDSGLTIPITNTTGFVSAGQNIFAQVSDGTCVNTGMITLLVVPGVPPGTASISISPTTLCASGPGNAQITVTLPPGAFDIEIEYSSPALGNQIFLGPGTMNGDIILLPYSGTTTYALTSVTPIAGGCGTTFSPPTILTLTITLQPDLSLSVFPDICAGDNLDLSTIAITDLNGTGLPITFHNASPASPGNEINPPIVSPGSNTTYYAYSGTAGCDDEVPITVTVSQPGSPVLGTTSVCENGAALDLSTLTDPSFPTGTWSGPGVSGNFFDPFGLSGNITLTFVPSGNCASSATTNVMVTQGGTPLLGSDQICENAVFPLDLTTLQDPGFPIGTWSGPGVSGTSFNPAGLSGIIAVTFTPTGICDLPEDAFIDVLPAGIPFLNSDQICENNGLYDLTLLEDPGFPGGIWSGTGVFGGFFDPAGQNGTITLTYSSSDPCILPVTTNITVTQGGLPILGTDAVCENSSAFNLQILEDPAFSGGTWSGPGVSGTFFNPSGQNGLITLTYIPADPCDTDAQTTIDVTPSGQPVLNFDEICEDAGLYDLSNLEDPNFPFGTWSGQGVSGNFLDPGGLSGNISLTFVPADPCDETAFTSVDILQAGTLNLGTDQICSNSGLYDLFNISDPNILDGDWSGQGVTGFGFDFDPTGLDGTYTLFFQPLSICIAPASTDIIVTPSNEPFLASDQICENSGIFDLTTLEDPNFVGTWSGPGVSGTDFDPTGLGGVVPLTFTSIEACDELGFTTIDVTPSFSPALGTAALCTSDGMLDLETLEDPTNPDGVWSGQGVSGTMFDPAGLAGNINLTFTPNDPCVFTNTTIVSVTAAGVPNLTTDQICQNNGTFNLVNLQDPSFPTGTWTGMGVSQNSIDPAALSGNINLTFTPAGNCASPYTTTLTINPSGTPNSGVETICDDDGLFDLNQIQDPNFTGIWSGTGVSGTNFDPSGQNGDVEIIFTSQNTCDDTDTTMITVLPGGIPSLGTDSICQNNGLFDLTDLLDINFPTGTWSGVGVSGNDFDPLNQNGPITLTYDSDNICADDANTILTVVQNATPTLQNDTICAGSGNFDLTNLNDPNFPTGTWTGNQVSGNILDANAGSGIINLTFQSQENCILPATGFVEIFDQQTPQPDSASICVGSNPVDLTTLQDPNFITGNWTGNGISGGFFTQVNSPGSFNLTFISDEKCVDPVTTIIEINEPPSAFNITETCLPGNQNYTVTFEITGGDPDSYTVNGNSVGSSFNSGNLISGNNYSFIIDDINGCGTQNIEGNVDCSCQTNAGTMPNTGAPVLICAGSNISVPAVQNSNLEPDDVLGYILHDNPGTSIGNIFAQSDTPDFSWLSVLIPGQTYYVSAIAANNDGSDRPDFTDNCLSIAPGTPIQIYEVDGSFQTQNRLCEGECLDVNLNFTGVGPYEIIITMEGFASQAVIPFAIGANDTTLSICPSFYGIPDAEFSFNLTEVSDQSCSKNFDSSSEITVTVSPTLSEKIEQTLCPGQSILSNGMIYDQNNPTGTEMITGGSSTGCDSLIDINLSFFAPAETTLRPRVCDGDFIHINGERFDRINPSGQQILPTASINGCDSVINVEIELLAAVSSLFNPTLCQGTRVEINGNFYDETTPIGTEIFENATADGCDSLVIVDLTFSQFSINDLNQTLCPGEGIVVNGVIYDQNNPTGQEIITGGSIAGCDSLINVALQFHAPASGGLRQTICPDESVEINGNTYDINNPSGVEILQNASANGCDSTVNIQLAFHSPATEEINSTICESDFIEVNGERFDIQNPAGQIILPSFSNNGCDSIINVRLDFFPPALSEINERLCEGEFIIINGNRYDETVFSGREIFPGASANGCDSIVTINLTFYPPAENTISLDLFTGEFVEVNGTIYDESNQNGVEILQNASAAGCDSTIIIQLRFTNISADLSFESPDCFGEQDGRIIIRNIQGSNPPFEILLNDNSSQVTSDSDFDFMNLEGGIYTVTIIDANGNEFEEIVELDSPIELNLSLDQIIEVSLGEDIVLNPSVNFTPTDWIWTPDDFLSCNDCSNPTVIQPFQNIEYSVEAIDEKGCSVSGRTRVEIQKTLDVFIPEAFSPNDDGINDIFRVFGGPQSVLVKTFAVFDRWGNQLYQRNDLAPDSNEGWDGSYNGQKMNSGVYVFFAEVEFLDGTTEIFKGDLTLTY